MTPHDRKAQQLSDIDGTLSELRQLEEILEAAVQVTQAQLERCRDLIREGEAERDRVERCGSTLDQQLMYAATGARLQ